MRRRRCGAHAAARGPQTRDGGGCEGWEVGTQHPDENTRRRTYVHVVPWVAILADHYWVMFSSFELFSPHPRRVALSRWRRPAGAVRECDELGPTRSLRYLPLVVFTTASVVVLPAALVAAL